MYLLCSVRALDGLCCAVATCRRDHVVDMGLYRMEAQLWRNAALKAHHDLEPRGPCFRLGTNVITPRNQGVPRCPKPARPADCTAPLVSASKRERRATPSPRPLSPGRAPQGISSQASAPRTGSHLRPSPRAQPARPPGPGPPSYPRPPS